MIDYSYTDASWHPILKKALESFDNDYLEFLNSGDYLPSKSNIFRAFESLKPQDVKYILFGQDPYPRRESAIGYAFIDGRVKEIFTEKGLSKEVNRATSLRNFIKMLLVARGDLRCEDTSQEAISKIDKSNLINSIYELRDNFIRSKVLLLNSSLVFEDKASSNRHLRVWQSFIGVILEELKEYSPTLILFGSHSKKLEKLYDENSFKAIKIEHPYNNSFICNKEAIELFGEMRLLNRN